VHNGLWLKDFLVFLFAAGLIVPLFHRARIGAVLGFLLIGIVVGPYGLGHLADEYPWLRYLTIEDRERVEPFAELGVIFLLFLVGIEMSTDRLWAMRRYVLGIGALQFVLSSLAIGSGLAFLGMEGHAAIILSLGLAMSSTAVVMQLLEEQGRTATPSGQIAISVLLFQDLMVAPVLFGIEILARGGDVLISLGSALLQAAAAVVLIATAGRYLLRPLLGFAGRTGSRELIMAVALLTVVGFAAGTSAVGLSSALGAFLAGLLMSETEYRHQVEIDVAPFKGLLVGLFFITVGMSVDIRAVAAEFDTVITAVLGLLAIKAVILFVVCRMFGVSLGTAAENAILLAQAGEFAFVVVALGRSTELLGSDVAQLATAVAAISMMATPILAAGARELARRLEFVEHRNHMPTHVGAPEVSDHVIIGGYGRVGQTVARILQAENVPYLALDTDGQLVREHRKRGAVIFFGDAARREFLERAGMAEARAVVVTVNHPRAAARMVAAAREERPDVPVYARARDGAHAAQLFELGAKGVIPEAMEASLQLAARVLEGLGVPDETVDRRLEETRQEEYAHYGLAAKRPANG
jgi:CPA2 family monovalent cation:H+ antiporter-2